MHLAAQYRSLRDKLGLTRLCVVTLALFFAFYLVLQQFLPSGENVIVSPYSNLGIFFSYVILTMCYAIICERTQGGVNLLSRTFWDRLGLLLAATSFYYMFFLSFGCAKSLISLIQPFYLDPFLQKLDIILHGGTAPSMWFASRIGPLLQYQLNMLYLFSWGLVMTVYFFWQLATPPSTGRTAFISTFLMAWVVIGLMLATLGSSVGPLYYSMFYYDGFSGMNADLVTHLYDPKILTPLEYPQNARNVLLDFYSSGTFVHLNGISAMPSMHSAIAILIMLHSLRYSRHLRYFTVPFAIAIFIGSFTLGWHYAVDSYVSGIVVYVLWQMNHHNQRY